ncbi:MULTISPECIES: RHS repeat-associated core domain-containing protein [Chryseobacterium]|uniref:RHS repeat-associated core domain n=1 Tax=Chryseobacterium taihuense TaxID=1141221 RepID=A0A4U8WFG6_9FLAO|nr:MULTISPECIES: RHS repeat-associated core domain-containing protein [Chryseobacterium]VFB03715.1 RHS repeat-associated core domain [Chryseobacterium taihuense]
MGEVCERSSVRVSFAREGNTAVIVQQNDYYAFGLKHSGGLSGNGSYKYEYNGKELQEELGMYDYGARFYMPDLGRWGVIDPLAEMYTRHSPYHYAVNNPMRFIDPDGRSALDGIKDSMPNIYSGWENTPGVNFGDWNNFSSGSQFNAFVSYIDPGGSSGGGGDGAIYNLFDGQGVGFTGVYAQQLFNYFLDNITASGELNIKGFHFVLEELTPTIYKFTLTAFQMGKPTILHYDGDKERVLARRKQNVHAMKTVSGYQRDEYPYASTLEGDRAMVTYVPSRENSIQGGTLGSMYRAAGLKTGDAFMVIPVPKGSTKEIMKEQSLLNTQPLPVPRNSDFRTPAVPHKMWPVLGVIAVGAFIYHFGWRFAL